MATKHYAYAIDTFMSGWGKAGAMLNVYCLVCETKEEAEYAARQLRGRSEMRSVKVSTKAPVSTSGVLVSYADRTMAQIYFPPR